MKGERQGRMQTKGEGVFSACGQHRIISILLVGQDDYPTQHSVVLAVDDHGPLTVSPCG